MAKAVIPETLLKPLPFNTKVKYLSLEAELELLLQQLRNAQSMATFPSYQDTQSTDNKQSSLSSSNNG